MGHGGSFSDVRQNIDGDKHGDGAENYDQDSRQASFKCRMLVRQLIDSVGVSPLQDRHETPQGA